MLGGLDSARPAVIGVLSNLTLPAAHNKSVGQRYMTNAEWSVNHRAGA